MFDVTFYISNTDAQGRYFSASHHMAFEGELLRLFYALSKTPTPGMTAYTVPAQGLVDGEWLVATAHWAKRHYGMEEVVITYLGQTEIL